MAIREENRLGRPTAKRTMWRRRWPWTDDCQYYYNYIAVVVNLTIGVTMADTHRQGTTRQEFHGGLQRQAASWRRSSWRRWRRRTRTRRPPRGRPQLFSTRPFCRLYDGDGDKWGACGNRVRTDTDVDGAKNGGRRDETSDNSTTAHKAFDCDQSPHVTLQSTVQQCCCGYNKTQIKRA